MSETTSIHCRGLGYPEGPLIMTDGGLVVTELARARGCVTRVVPHEDSHEPIAVTGRPNGLALDAAGRLWVAESLYPGLLVVSLDGEVEVRADSCAGEPLLWPNDLCFGPDGAIYMTDSGALVDDFLDGDAPRPDFESVPLDGKLLRFDRDTGEGTILDRGLRFANGIAFDAGGVLYVSETLTGDIHRYREGASGLEREHFANVLDPDWGGTTVRGPDGMAFSEDGDLYVAVFGQGDVTVIDRTGMVLDRIGLRGHAPTNLAFGPPGSGLLYVTEDELGQVEAIDVDVDGLRLWR